MNAYLRTAVFALFSATLICLVGAAAIAIQPTMLYLGWALLLAFFLVAFLQATRLAFFRVLLFALGAFITMRYLLFRGFCTLYLDSTPGLICAIILFIAECYAILVHFSGLFVNLYPKKRPDPPLPEVLPSIDIFIPTYSEDIEVTLTTALACKRLEYPGHLVSVYVLDDGCRLPRLNDPALQAGLLERHKRLKAAAESVGAIYLTRADGDKAKAGMLNAALLGRAFPEPVRGEDGLFAAGTPVPTRGGLVLILDCDHVPARDFLQKTVGHFSDPNLFLAQTPHFMLNADPVRKNLDDEIHLPCESWLFYRNMQQGLDRWGGVFFCGSAALLRRSMLEETGGLRGDTITEDCETALALHSRGYGSVYVSKPLIVGLAPESMVDMIKQRQRWCQGMLQIFLLKNPLAQRGLSLAQRLCYLNNCLFWFFPFPRLVFTCAPLMFLLFGLNIFSASIGQVINFAGPHIVASLLLSVMLHGKLRPFLHSEVLETLQSFFLAPAIVSVFLRPRKPVFLTTRKGVTLEKDSVSPLVWPFLILFALLLAGFIRGACLWTTDPLLRDAVLVTFFWNAYNTLIVLCCLGALWERKQRRGAHRIRLEQPAIVDGRAVTLTSLSLSGLRFASADSHFSLGRNCMFRDGAVKLPIRIVRKEAGQAAAVFTEQADKGALVDYVYGDSDRWQKIMDDVLLGHGGYGLQSARFIKAGLRGCAALFGGLARKAWPGAAGALLTLLLPAHQAGAAIVERTVASLTNESLFTVASSLEDLRIPFYISKRNIIHGASLEFSYSRAGVYANQADPLTVIIDEEAITGKTGLGGDGVRTATFILPPEKLVAGQRMAVLRVAQSLPEAPPAASGPRLEKTIGEQADSGAFWTDINLERSRLRIEYSPKKLVGEERTNFKLLFDEHVLAAKQIHVMLPEITPATMARAAKAVQRIALAIGARPLDVTVSGEADYSRDTIIIADNAGELRAAMPQMPYFALLTEEDIPENPQSGQRLLEAGGTLSFRELGLNTLTFRPWHSMRNSVFMIPTRTCLPPNRSLRIALDLLYSPGLHKSSRLDVHVNQEILASIPLDNINGMRQSQYIVYVPASLLDKGNNILSVRPVLIPASSERWEKDETLAVTVFSTSTFSLPDTGVFVKVPDLSSITADSYPFYGDGHIYIPKPTPETAAAFLNFAAQIAQRRGSLSTATELSFAPWQAEDRNSIVMAVNPEFPAKTLGLRAELIDGARDKVRLTLEAASGAELRRGVLALWDDKARRELRGVAARVEYESGRVSVEDGPTRIVSDTGPLAGIAYYANNNPLAAGGIIMALILLFSLTGFILSGKGR